jgi:hypothetical protein
MICPMCEVDHPWHGLCDRCLDIRRSLRPKQQPSVSSMNTNMQYLKYLLFACAVALIIMLACAGRAEARPPAPPGTPKACLTVWHKSKAGRKYDSMRACIDRYCAKPLTTPRAVKVKGVRVDRGQRRVLAWLVNEGRERKLPRVFLLAAIATTTQESSARELDHGHGTSVGPFQLIDIHGPASLRKTVAFSGNWFYNGARKVYVRGMDPVTLSHRVQRSAHPTATARWIPEARRSLKKILGPCRIKR